MAHALISCLGCWLWWEQRFWILLYHTANRKAKPGIWL